MHPFKSFLTPLLLSNILFRQWAVRRQIAGNLWQINTSNKYINRCTFTYFHGQMLNSKFEFLPSGLNSQNYFELSAKQNIKLYAALFTLFHSSGLQKTVGSSQSFSWVTTTIVGHRVVNLTASASCWDMARVIPLVSSWAVISPYGRNPSKEPYSWKYREQGYVQIYFEDAKIFLLEYVIY